MEVGARPLVVVSVVARTEKRPTTAVGLLELVGKFVEHRLDLSLVSLEALRVELRIYNDTLDLDVIAGIFAVT